MGCFQILAIVDSSAWNIGALLKKQNGNKKSPSKIFLDPNGFTNELVHAFTGDILPILLRLFQEILEIKTLPNSFYKAAITVIPKAERHSIKRELLTNFSINTDTKMLNKILGNKFQQLIKKFIHQDQVGFILWMQGWFNICKYINVIHQINKEKSQMIISVDTERAFDKIQYSVLIKTLNKMGTENTFFNIIKVIYHKPIGFLSLNILMVAALRGRHQTLLFLSSNCLKRNK